MGMRASGRPTNSTAWAAAVATTRAMGSAIPTSSAACTTSRRAMKRGSSPAASMGANQVARGVGIAAGQFLDEGGDEVVVDTPPPVVQEAPPLAGLLGHGQGD